MSADQVERVARFAGGNRHAVYRVSYRSDRGERGDAVVRVARSADARECAQGQREAAVLAVVGGVVAPLLFDFRCSSKWFDTPAMCIDFADGREHDIADASADEMVQLGTLVAWLHDRPTAALADALGGRTSLRAYAAERWDTIHATLEWAREPLPRSLQSQLAAAAQRLATTFEAAQTSEAFDARHDSVVLMHGDLGPGNVMWAERPVLIDWEYTRLGDRADEIAYLFDQNGLGEMQREAFWAGYRGGAHPDVPIEAATERVAWWEPVSLLGSTLWWVERWVRRTESNERGRIDPELQRDAGYYLEQVIRRLGRLEALLGSLN
jgi:aminoglycoside phosphotransferase (APT) family kinase protein